VAPAREGGRGLVVLKGSRGAGAVPVRCTVWEWTKECPMKKEANPSLFISAPHFGMFEG